MVEFQRVETPNAFGAAAPSFYARPEPVEAIWPIVAKRLLRLAAGTAIVALVIWSAILAKTARHAVPLANIRFLPIETVASAQPLPITSMGDAPAPEEIPTPASVAARAGVAKAVSGPLSAHAFDPSVRWFNGRPIRPARTLWMTVTAYSPDERSCGAFADGLTATLHSVHTNDFALVAADPTILPYGSMITVPGYDRDRVVPVLDCGGAIKGHRLDVLYPTHERARQWGVRRIRVTVWQYADGLPPDNPRKLR